MRKIFIALAATLLITVGSAVRINQLPSKSVSASSNPKNSEARESRKEDRSDDRRRPPPRHEDDHDVEERPEEEEEERPRREEDDDEEEHEEHEGKAAQGAQNRQK